MATEQANDYTVYDSPVVSDELNADLVAIAELVQTVAQRYGGNSIALLALLRILEASHREICDGPFRDALPESRHQLYSFLKDMEAEGGWPYIPRMKLRSLISWLDEQFQDAQEREDQPSDQPGQSQP